MGKNNYNKEIGHAEQWLVAKRYFEDNFKEI